MLPNKSQNWFPFKKSVIFKCYSSEKFIAPNNLHEYM